jgi:hypothetical protein
MIEGAKAGHRARLHKTLEVKGSFRPYKYLGSGAPLLPLHPLLVSSSFTPLAPPSPPVPSPLRTQSKTYIQTPPDLAAPTPPRTPQPHSTAREERGDDTREPWGESTADGDGMEQVDEHGGHPREARHRRCNG